jgi:hypothetical protein
MDRPKKATLLGQQYQRALYKSEPCILLEGGSDSKYSSVSTRKSSKDICARVRPPSMMTSKKKILSSCQSGTKARVAPLMTTSKGQMSKTAPRLKS